jgi:hypothetical protein
MAADLLNDVAASVLVDVVVEAGRRLGTALVAHRGRRHREDFELARRLDTYQLAGAPPELPGVPNAPAADVLAGALQHDGFHSVLHELLAARLTGAPEADIDRIRTGMALMLGKAMAGADAGEFGDALFDYYDDQVCDLVGRLAGAFPAALADLRREAFAARMVAILQAVERHAAALAGQADPAADAAFIDRYRSHVTDYHGKLEPPDFERRRRIPIGDLYVTPSIVQIIDADIALPLRVIDLWTLAGELDRTVLLGHPGGGKTSAAHVLMDHFGRAAGRQVPFLVTLRDFAADDPPARSVTGHIENRLEIFYQCVPPPGLVSRLLLNGLAVVIFDGMDELLDSARRADVTAVIERFCAEYPQARVLVTARIVGYDQARLDDEQFVRYRLDGFGEAETASYVAKWFARDETLQPADALAWAQAFMAESAQMPDLRSNPLMLALMCILYRGEGSLPRNRPEVYEHCSNLLFRKWDARRRIHVELRARHLVEPALRHLAFWLLGQGAPAAAVTERELIRETTGFLHGRGYESLADAEEAAREFVGFCRGRAWVFSDTGTTAAGEPLYTFTHRTFLEYFAAAHIAATADTPEELARFIGPRVARQEWHVVTDLAVQIKDKASDRGAERVMATLLADRRHRSVRSRSHTLEFLAHSLRFLDPPPRLVRELSQGVLDHALSGDPDEPLRCYPLHQLLLSCFSVREIVGDEVAQRVAALASSANPDDIVTGLRLALWADDKNIELQNDRVGRWDRGLWAFWAAFGDTSMRAHADVVLAAAAQHPVIRYSALVRGLIGIDDILAGRPADLDVLFTDFPTFFGIAGPPYLPRLAWGVVRGLGGYNGKDPVPDFMSFGQYALRHPRLPLVTSPSGYGGWLDDLNGEGEAGLLTDDIAYLGAALAFAIGFEASDAVTLPVHDERLLGPLRDLYPYLARRMRVAAGLELADLPVPAPYAGMFRAWASGELNLTAGTFR